MRASSRSLLVLVLAGAMSACSATVHRHRAPDVDGIIEDSDETGLVVRVRHRRYWIPAEQVDDVDHPGNVLMVVGGVALGMAAMLGVIAAAQRTQGDRQAFNLTAFTYTGMGVAFIAGGGIPWARSRGAAMRLERSQVTPPLLPIECAPLAGASSACPVEAPDQASRDMLLLP